jgi:hypothetical protein
MANTCIPLMPFPNYGIKKNLYIAFKNILMYSKIKRENSRKLMDENILMYSKIKGENSRILMDVMRGALLVVANVTYQFVVDPPE